MARITKKELIAEIELRVNQGAPSNDTELEYTQIGNWFNIVGNEMVAKEVDKCVNKGDQIPSVYIDRETCKQIVEEDVACVDEADERMGFELTGTVLDTDNDNGVVLVMTDEDQEVYKASLQTLPMLKLMTYTAPTSELLLWSRQGTKIFIDGFVAADLDFNNITVYFIKKIDFKTLGEDDVVPISDRILPTVIERVVELAKDQMYGSQADKTNDGTDVKDVIYHRAIQNAKTDEQ